MLQEVIDLHDEAVSSLIEKIREKDNVTFKSPTGSGKTHMMADLMNRILSERDDIVFIVSTLSKGNLGQQNYEKFVEYQQHGDFPMLKPYIISTSLSGEESLFIPTDYNVYVLPRDLYKEGGLLMRGSMDNFLQEITANLYGSGLNKQIYVIKDECHQATNNLDELARLYFTKTINISATPKLSRGQVPDVEITEEQAINSQLIKKVELCEDEVDVSVAIDKFEEIKEKYRNLLGVNPCLIIQISNKDKADEELEKIFNVLNKPEHQALKWMTIMQKTQKGRESNEGSDTNDDCKHKGLPVSRWRDYVKESSSTVDIIIFKMVISEGWDIPRACMLYQVRNTKSDQLDEQVLGRVRRNPRLLDFEKLSDEAKELAMTAWVWGLRKKEEAKIRYTRLFEEPTDITDNLRIKTTRLKTWRQRDDFDVEAYLAAKPKHATYGSIFDLYRKLKNADKEIKDMCSSYATDTDRWFLFAENADDIIAKNSSYLCDYSESMVLSTDEEGKVKEVSFPIESSYTDMEKYVSIGDWVWKRKGVDSAKFSFDSDAEREFAEILKELAQGDNAEGERVAMRVDVGKNNPHAGELLLDGSKEPQKLNPEKKYLWGKNFLSQSEIKFEYCLGKIHSSYPDFVMKDYYGRIHLFEVKSVNCSNASHFDSDDYKDKMEELKRCYKQASLLTGYNFYLPVLKGEVWHISLLANGEEKTLTLNQFKDYVKAIP